MKIVEKWEVKVYENGEESTGIPLPGCIIYGEIEGQEVRIEVLDINMSKLTCIDIYGEKYILSGAKSEYLEVLNTAVKYYERQEQSYDEER